MQAVILAAGKGLRVGSQKEVPACLVKIGGKTLLEHNLSELPREVKEVIVVVGELKARIKKHLGKNHNGRTVRFVEQKERLGTGHALSVCQSAITSEKFIVMMSDNLYLARDITACLKNSPSILAKKLEAPERFGVIEGEGGTLAKVSETRKSSAGTLINCGLYVLDKRVFDFPEVRIANDEFGLPQQVALMSRKFPVRIIQSKFWMPINTIQDIKQADKYIKKIYI